jgi:hypothetical protein
MKASPGEELACKAHNFKFGGVERGIVSYYAVQCLDRADTMGSWLTSTHRAIDEGERNGELPPEKKPYLQLLGDENAKVPGRPVT